MKWLIFEAHLEEDYLWIMIMYMYQFNISYLKFELLEYVQL